MKEVFATDAVPNWNCTDFGETQNVEIESRELHQKQ
jgi:hypothetical protein